MHAFSEAFDAGRVVEHFDADPAALVDIGQCREDGHEIDFAKAGALQVGVVGVEVDHHVALAWMISGIGCGSLAIALQSKCRRTHGELTRFTSSRPSAAVTRKSPSLGPSGSTAIVTPHSSKVGSAGKHIGGVLHRLRLGDARQQVALLGRAEHHDRTAQIAAQLRQFAR